MTEEIHSPTDTDVDAAVAEEIRHLKINCGIHVSTDEEIAAVRATVVARLNGIDNNDAARS